LLGGKYLSKSSVSSVVTRLKELFSAWTSRNLSGDLYNIIYLDGFHLTVRMARRVVSDTTKLSKEWGPPLNENSCGAVNLN